MTTATHPYANDFVVLPLRRAEPITYARASQATQTAERRVAEPVLVRKARAEEAEAISRLNNLFADEQLMLRRTPDMIALAIDDYVVAVDARGEILACGALKEYSPSVAEVAAIAVSKAAHGRGLGRGIVRAVEALAMKRGIYDVFALTLQPEFFEAIGYTRVDRARYPEKIRRDCLACARRFACNEICYARNLLVTDPRTEIAPSTAEHADRRGGGVAA
jgi:N-acetylglutamate synthase-like GNAT family acetyltransferase